MLQPSTLEGVPSSAQRQQDAHLPEDGGHVAEGRPSLLQPVLPRTQHGVRDGGALPPPPLLQRLHGDRADSNGSEGNDTDEMIFSAAQNHGRKFREFKLHSRQSIKYMTSE